MNAPIVVGYDGSPGAEAALLWAARTARREHRPLRIIHVGLGQGGSRALTDGLDRARAEAPGIEASASLDLRESVPGTLVEESKDAHLVVVGSRGRGGFSGLLLGSVSTALVAHAHCPVVVARPISPTAAATVRPVVVGVDGSPTSARAVDLAFDQASRLAAPLVAVHAWEMPAVVGAGAGWSSEHIAEREGTQRALLAESLAGHAERYPDVEVERVVRLGRAAEVVLHASVGAQLLVVGSRGRGGFRGLLLGSVSQAVVHHATCPVVVVHPAAPGKA